MYLYNVLKIPMYLFYLLIVTYFMFACMWVNKVKCLWQSEGGIRSSDLELQVFVNQHMNTGNWA